MGKDILRCPRCGFTFSRAYARVTSCSGCPTSVSGCPMIKCPKCGHEFKVT